MNEETRQHFVQTCAAYGSLRTTDAIEILKAICNKYEVEPPHDVRFKEFISTLNNDYLNQYDHDIAIIKYPITKEEFIVFRSLNAKAFCTLNQFTEQERNYFRIILTTIACNENYGIDEIRAMNITSQMPDKSLPKQRAESLIQNWKQVGYFFESEGTLYLGPRTIVEFESFLLNYFPDDIKKCSLCKKIVLWDPSCDDCESKFHSECIRRYLIKSSNCPACQKVWNTSFV